MLEIGIYFFPLDLRSICVFQSSKNYMHFSLFLILPKNGDVAWETLFGDFLGGAQSLRTHCKEPPKGRDNWKLLLSKKGQSPGRAPPGYQPGLKVSLGCN